MVGQLRDVAASGSCPLLEDVAVLSPLLVSLYVIIAFLKRYRLINLH